MVRCLSAKLNTEKTFSLTGLSRFQVPQNGQFKLRDTYLEFGVPRFVVPQSLVHFFVFAYLLRLFAS